MSAGPHVGVLFAPGTNRDEEAARAFEMAGGSTERVMLHDLRAGDVRLDRFDVVAVPGGFSYGDALGAGTRFALEVGDPLRHYASSGRPVLGICNGFQVLVRAGLFGENLTLTDNDSGRFECRWVHLWAAALDRVIACPVAHAEGRLAGEVDESMGAFRYVDRDGSPVHGDYPQNPNGSIADMAGLVNATGNVMGLMPHPEDNIVPEHDAFGRPEHCALGVFEEVLARA